MSDRWKRWAGGEMPEELRGGKEVEVRLRDGTIGQSFATDYIWEHCEDYNSWDIVDYRVIGEDSVETSGPAAETKPHSHYHKDVSHLTSIDVYRVLDLFGVTDQAIGHAAKKLLVAGGRGHKSLDKDIQDTIDTLLRWQEMRKEDNAV